jgi:translation elongation factor EF-4
MSLTFACSYATFDYEEGEYRLADLQRLDILAHGTPVDALARLVARSEVDAVGRFILAKLKDVMERQQFDIILQVVIHIMTSSYRLS